ncbi:MAG TPA: MotA/TolQ/ExbB proton channel family protein [Phycisphaerales bacterium]|nr:MotA/TolQ/ExbB proton channel family protein [Phycisphaerales bacterium]
MITLARLCLLALLGAAVLALPALAQTTPAAGGGTPVATGGLWSLFVKSFDLFTVLLLLGSVAGVAAIFMCMMDVREQNITPPKTIARLRDLARAKRWEDLSMAVHEDESFVARVVKATLAAPVHDKAAMREAAELAASEESARWFRKIDVLNVIGNLGPLVGLAGTVYGMILAFTSLGEAGGQAGPGDLSLGISKALFHTLLGLCLAIPCLLIYGLYRGVVDRLCTRGIVAASEIIELLPVREPEDAPVGAGPRAVIAGAIKAPSHT